SQRWAEARLAQLLDEGAGRAAVVDLGLRHHVVTPYTSFYVPTKNEMTPEERMELAKVQLATIASTRWRARHEPTEPGEADRDSVDEDGRIANGLDRAQKDVSDQTRRVEQQRAEISSKIAEAKQAEVAAKRPAPVTVAAAPVPPAAT